MRASRHTGAAAPDDRLWTPTLSDREFGRFQSLIRSASGIHLGEHKRALLIGRLARRLRELGLPSFDSYYEHVLVGGDEALRELLNCVVTHETQFFREPDHFVFLQTRALGELEALAACGQRPRRLRVWSAACSTGEEPYSLAMLLRSRFAKESGWDLEILASDLSTRALARTEAATWPIQSAMQIPYDYLRHFMLRGTGSAIGRMRACADLRALVRCRRINLNDEIDCVPGRFDLIFCRNVLIYFDAETRLRVARQLLRKLDPQGYFFLGHAETLTGLVDDVQCVAPNVYRLVGSAEASGVPGHAAPELVA